MSVLTIYPEQNPQDGVQIDQFEAIQEHMDTLGVYFEHWSAAKELAADASQQEVLDAYSDSIAAFQEICEFKSLDVVSLRPDHPDKIALREKFFAEHTHDDFEVRFFVEGRGLFYFHVDDKVLALLCERGDLVSVPANTRHWFDMGENPDFKCIRLFTIPDGWVASFTGSDIAKNFPTFDQYLGQLT